VKSWCSLVDECVVENEQRREAVCDKTQVYSFYYVSPIYM